jgi:hypothetical protein
MTEEWNFVAALPRTAKSLREIKSLVESAYGDKNVSNSLRNSLVKAVKDKIDTKRRKGPPTCSFYRRRFLGSLVVNNRAYIKTALDKYQPIFKPKSSELSSSQRQSQNSFKRVRRRVFW